MIQTIKKKSIQITFLDNSVTNYEYKSFLENIYKDLGKYDNVNFVILGTRLNEMNRMLEAVIHRYCRAVGFVNYTIEFSEKINKKPDIIFPNKV